MLWTSLSGAAASLPVASFGPWAWGVLTSPFGPLALALYWAVHDSTLVGGFPLVQDHAAPRPTSGESAGPRDQPL